MELLAIFSPTLFTMIAAILKVVLSLQGPREDDSWLFTWSAIEAAIFLSHDSLKFLPESALLSHATSHD